MRRFLFIALWGLGAITIAALLIRVLAVAEPLGIDQGLWASAVRGMARGQRLYQDVWEQRPPGIYWIYLAGFKLFGWTAATVAWLDVLAAVLTTACILAIGIALGSAFEGATASALYATMTMPAWLYRYDGFLERSVCETFIVPSVALAACCAVKSRTNQSWVWATGIGLFAGCAIVLKPNAGLYLPAMLLWAAAFRNVPLASIGRRTVIAGVAAAVVPAIALAWLWRLGVLHEAKVAVIDFNRFYVSEGFSVSGYAVAFAKAVWLRIKTEPLWTAGAAGAVAAVIDLVRSRRLPPLAGLAITWGAAAALVIVVNGARLFNSYFINAFAPLSLLGAWWIVSATRASRARQAAVLATLAVMAVLLVQRHYVAKVLDWAGADLAVLRGTLDRTTYLERFGGYSTGRGYSARANAELADYVRTHTTADDRIFLFGINGAEVYFSSDRLIAQRFLRVNFFIETYFPDPRFRLDAVIAELETRRPTFVMFETLHSASEMGRAVDRLQDDPAVGRLLSGYRRETVIEDFTIYRRVD